MITGAVKILGGFGLGVAFNQMVDQEHLALTVKDLPKTVSNWIRDNKKEE